MPATDAERTRLRRKFLSGSTSMSDEYIDDVFNEAEEKYSTYSREVVVAAAYLNTIQDLITGASRDYDYKISESEDKKSQVFNMLQKRKVDYQAELDNLIAKETPSPVRWGSLHKIPTRQKEYPDA